MKNSVKVANWDDNFQVIILSLAGFGGKGGRNNAVIGKNQYLDN